MLKKAIKYLLIIICIFSITSCKSKEITPTIPLIKNDEETSVVHDKEISDELLDIFNDAQSRYEDMLFEPLELMYSQTNGIEKYVFLCKEIKDSFALFARDYMVTITKDSEGNYQIADYEEY